MRRIVKVLTVALIMVAMMGASALPALAQGPPTTFSALPDQVLGNVLYAIGQNPAIDIIDDNACLNTPGPGIGHHSGYPEDSPCQL